MTRLYLDTSNLNQIKIWSPVISGVTTNPSILKNEGLMKFSINDHALNDNFFFNEIKNVIKRSKFILLDQIYGDHIKELSLNSSIFVLQKSEC